MGYGDLLEERWQEFLDATARSPHFKYSLTVTILLLIEMAACAKLWYDLRKIKRTDAKKLADVLSHDRYSREAARETVRRYNEHIEKGKRASNHCGLSSRKLPQSSLLPFRNGTKRKRNWSRLVPDQGGNRFS